jgi:hypothetical protein
MGRRTSRAQWVAGRGAAACGCQWEWRGWGTFCLARNLGRGLLVLGCTMPVLCLTGWCGPAAHEESHHGSGPLRRHGFQRGPLLACAGGSSAARLRAWVSPDAAITGQGRPAQRRGSWPTLGHRWPGRDRRGVSPDGDRGGSSRDAGALRERWRGVWTSTLADALPMVSWGVTGGSSPFAENVRRGRLGAWNTSERSAGCVGGRFEWRTGGW